MSTVQRSELRVKQPGQKVRFQLSGFSVWIVRFRVFQCFGCEAQSVTCGFDGFGSRMPLVRVARAVGTEITT